MTVTVKPKPGPVKPLVKPSAPTSVSKPAPSKVAAQTIKKLMKPPVQSIAPEDDPSSGVEEVVEETTEELVEAVEQEAAIATPGNKVGKPVKVVTTKANKDGTSTTEEEVKGDVLVNEPHATVGVSVGVTKNLGNYESVKVTVSVFIPCAVDADEINETYEQAKEWVDEKVAAISQEIDDQIAS